MPIQRTLLERLRHPDPSGGRRSRVSQSEILDSIIRNLKHLLNTSQGNSLLDDNYGLPHLSSIRSTMPHSLNSFIAAIRATIERNEPRLRNVRVVHRPTATHAGELRFEITAVVVDDDQRINVRFETVADDTGRMALR